MVETVLLLVLVGEFLLILWRLIRIEGELGRLTTSRRECADRVRHVEDRVDNLYRLILNEARKPQIADVPGTRSMEQGIQAPGKSSLARPLESNKSAVPTSSASGASTAPEQPPASRHGALEDESVTSNSTLQSAGEIQLVSSYPSGSEDAPPVCIGSMQGRWNGRKSFTVSTLTIHGRLYRQQLFSLGEKLNVKDELERALSSRRNDDPVHLDLICVVGIKSDVQVLTPYPGPIQDFSPMLIPRIEVDRSRLNIEVRDESRPLLITVRARTKES